MDIEKKITEIQQTQNELRMAVNIIASVLLRFGNYLYNHFDDPNIKSHLKDLGDEIKSIKEPRKR